MAGAGMLHSPSSRQLAACSSLRSSGCMYHINSLHARGVCSLSAKPVQVASYAHSNSCLPGTRVLRLLAAASPAAASARGPGPLPLSGGTSQLEALNAVRRLYDAINQRDVAALTACFAADVQYQNLAFADTFSGATAVARFYQDSLNALPEGAEIQLEQHTGHEQSRTAGSSMAVVWRLLLPASGTTVSRGIAFFTLDAADRILSITDSPEHPVKLSARGLTVFGPLVQGLAGSMLPAVQELGRAMQQGVDLLLQPLEGIMTQADSSNSSWPTDSSSSLGGSSSSAGYSSSSSSSWQQPSTLSTNSAPVAGNQASAVPASATPAGPRAVYATASTPAAVGAGSAPSATAAPAGSRRSVAAAATGAGPAGVPGSAQQPPDQPNFSGLWVKVPERSDQVGYEAALDVLGLSGLQKVTARLIEGIDIQQSSTKFTVNFVTVVPFFKVTEDVPLDGGSVQLGRRDLRFGRQSTAARSVPGGVLVEMSWGAPMAGSLTEKYTLLEDGCLCVEAHTRVGDKAANSKSVYRRTSGNRDELLSDSKKRNPSVAAVLQQQRQEGLDV